MRGTFKTSQSPLYPPFFRRSMDTKVLKLLLLIAEMNKERELGS